MVCWITASLSQFQFHDFCICLATSNFILHESERFLQKKISFRFPRLKRWRQVSREVIEVIIQCYIAINIIGYSIDWLFSSQIPSDTHKTSPSSNITHRVHTDPWRKTIQIMCFSFFKARITWTIFPRRFSMRITGTLSHSAVYKSFYCTGSVWSTCFLLLTNHMTFSKWLCQ